MLLVNVMRVAVLSSPVSFGWPVEPRLDLIFYIPYALIIPVCIGGALIGHIALTRALLRREGLIASNGEAAPEPDGACLLGAVMLLA